MLSEESFKDQRAGGKEHGIGGRQEVDLRAYERKQEVENNERPAQRPVWPQLPVKEVGKQARQPEWQGKGIHRNDLLEEKAERVRRVGMPASITAPEFERRPAVGGVPEDIGQEKGKRERAAEPGPLAPQIDRKSTRL